MTHPHEQEELDAWFSRQDRFDGFDRGDLDNDIGSGFDMPTKIKEHTFKARAFYEGSWGERDAGECEQTQTLYFNGDTTGCIEWDLPALEEFVEIGLWFEIGPNGTRTLTDYDGVMSLNKPAIQLMRDAGVIVPADFE